MRDREAEHRQDPVALDLHDVAVEFRFDHLAARGVVARHQRAVCLRLPALRELGGAHHVAEHDRQTVQLADAGAELVATDRGLAHGMLIHTVTAVVFPFSVAAFTCPTYVPPRYPLPSARSVNSVC